MTLITYGFLLLLSIKKKKVRKMIGCHVIILMLSVILCDKYWWRFFFFVNFRPIYTNFISLRVRLSKIKVQSSINKNNKIQNLNLDLDFALYFCLLKLIVNRKYSSRENNSHDMNSFFHDMIRRAKRRG